MVDMVDTEELLKLRRSGSLSSWAEYIDRWADEKGWNEKEITQGEWIALAHSELSEALEAYRDPGLPGLQVAYVNGKPEGVRIEMADCLIRILHWFARHGLSANDYVAIKMNYNKTRPYKHGGKSL